jgi:hypothetical protein
MDTLVLVKVDQFGCCGDSAEGSFADGIGQSGEGQHRPVVIRVHGMVQKPDIGYGGHCLNQGLNDGGISAFAEVRDTFDEWPHRHSLAYSIYDGS